MELQPQIFRDRVDAGAQLAPLLKHYQDDSNVVVVGLARGGVVVAKEVARRLNVPLGVVAPRKVGAPGQLELAIGAIMESGESVWHQDLIAHLGVTKSYIDEAMAAQKRIASERNALFHAAKPAVYKGRTVLLVDDGIATGATMLVVAKAMKNAQAKRVVIVAPVVSPRAIALLQPYADEIISIGDFGHYSSISVFYQNFAQVSDEEVCALLELTGSREVQCTRYGLKGTLTIPVGAQGIVVFAHGSGSGRHSPRNQYVALFLNQHRLATFLVDLLTQEEEEVDNITRALRFDIPMLAERLIAIREWLKNDPIAHSFAVGYFGASTGAAAALIAAAKDPVKAVVSRGGRPDLAAEFLEKVTAPTLLLVGSQDTQVIELNEAAYQMLSCEKQMELIPGATHLFEEPGTLEKVAQRSADWFLKYLT